jgi:D-glycero-D-manno-heptose 1,7-bisphosphate phosphatase
VTNQSGVARGLLDEAALSEIHATLARALAEFGVVLDHVGYCPHHPDFGQPPYRAHCDCRKPLPGLLRVAADELPIDLERSWVVGDSVRDLEAGAALGLPGILVATGKGRDQAGRLDAAGHPPKHYVPDLAAAVALILETDRQPG